MTTAAPTSIEMSPADLREILKLTRAASPDEACGLVVGRREGDTLIVTRVVEATNVVQPDDRPKRFEVDPETRIRLEKRLRGTPDELIGHWHSHPFGPPSPSARDLAQAYEPELIWLICAPDTSPPLTAWRADPKAGGFRPIPVLIAKEIS
ncbi:MAG: M67 family metallopeptidase [Alphaproteobacteria bacterium]|nr:M67 family metallopeptidase [Alphaproteobacteria bacterium]